MSAKGSAGAARGLPVPRPEWVTDARLPSDAELLDFLQSLTDRTHYTGLVVLRESEDGRGWRLHETSRRGNRSVRGAITDFAVDYFSEDP